VKKVQIWHHKDGDKLSIAEVPWWVTPYEWFVNKLFCPCCGFSGWLSGKSNLASIAHHNIWQRLLDVSAFKDEILFEVSIESGCIASKAIWGSHDICWLDDCPINGWQGSDDSYDSKGD